MNLQIGSNNNYKNPPSFKSKVYYMGENCFNHLVKKFPNVPEAAGTYTGSSILYPYEWLIENAVIEKPRAITLDARNCVVAVFINPVRKLLNMYHLSPYEGTMSRLQEIQNTIFEQAKKLKADTKENLQGLIMAGDFFTKENVDLCSVALLDVVKNTASNIAEKIGMDTTIIAGRKNTLGVSVFSDALRNKHNILVSKDYPIEPDENILENFGIKEISPNDKLATIINNRIWCPVPVVYDLN